MTATVFVTTSHVRDKKHSDALSTAVMGKQNDFDDLVTVKSL